MRSRPTGYFAVRCFESVKRKKPSLERTINFKQLDALALGFKPQRILALCRETVEGFKALKIFCMSVCSHVCPCVPSETGHGVLFPQPSEPLAHALQEQVADLQGTVRRLQTQPGPQNTVDSAALHNLKYVAAGS